MKKQLLDVLKTKIIKSSWLHFAIYFISALIITILILNWNKNTKEIENLFIFLIKLTPYFFGLLAIACLPVEKFNKLLCILLILLNFACIFCYFIPRLFYFFLNPDWDRYYLKTQMLVPFIILSLLLSYRLGGGKIKDVIILGVNSILFMLSGIEDLCYFLVNRLDIPKEWSWPSHMIVRLGKIPTKNEAFVFIGVHFFLILLIFFLAYSKYSPFTKLRDLNKELNKDLNKKESENIA